MKSRRRFIDENKQTNKLLVGLNYFGQGNVACWHKTDVARCPIWVCAVQRRRFPVGANPTRQPLQPEAIGAVMEVTKWLKPSISVSRIGGSASVQAVTRVNAEQSSKRTMRRPTRQPFRGRLIRLGEAERRVRPAAAPGEPARDRLGALGWRRGS